MGGAVTRARLDGNRLTDAQAIWRQEPKTIARGHKPPMAHLLVITDDKNGELLRLTPASKDGR